MGKREGGPGNPQELNRYSYALNNPLKFTDPRGHFAWIVAAAAGGAIINAGLTFVAEVIVHKGDLSKVNYRSVATAAASGAVSGALVAAGGPLLGSVAISMGLPTAAVVATIGRGLANTVLSVAASGLTDAVTGFATSRGGDTTVNAVTSVSGAAFAASLGDQLGAPTRGMDTWGQARGTMSNQLTQRPGWQQTQWAAAVDQQRFAARGGNWRAILMNTATTTIISYGVGNAVSVLYQSVRSGVDHME